MISKLFSPWTKSIRRFKFKSLHFKKSQSNATAKESKSKAKTQTGGSDTIPARCMVERISRVRYMIAVSRLTPHRASLVLRADSSRVFFFLTSTLVLWIQTQAARSHINQRHFSCHFSGFMGREEEAERELRLPRRWTEKMSKRRTPNRDGMVPGESGLVWFTHLEIKSAPAAPTLPWQCFNYLEECMTTAPGEVWHHALNPVSSQSFSPSSQV